MNHVIILCNDHDKGSFFRLKRKWVNGIYVTFRKGNFFCLFVYLAINKIRLTRRVSLRLVPVTPFIPIVQPFMRATLWRLVLGIFFTQLKTWDLLRGILTERLQLTIKSVSSTQLTQAVFFLVYVDTIPSKIPSLTRSCLRRGIPTRTASPSPM